MNEKECVFEGGPTLAQIATEGSIFFVDESYREFYVRAASKVDRHLLNGADEVVKSLTMRLQIREGARLAAGMEPIGTRPVGLEYGWPSELPHQPSALAAYYVHMGCVDQAAADAKVIRIAAGILTATAPLGTCHACGSVGSTPVSGGLCGSCREVAAWVRWDDARRLSDERLSGRLSKTRGEVVREYLKSGS